MRVPPYVRALLWKEWRERWGYWLGLLALSAAGMWICRTTPKALLRPVCPRSAWVLLWAIPGLLAGATAISHERAHRTVEFLANQALTRRQVWLLKAVASAAFFASLLVLCVLLHHVIRPFHFCPGRSENAIRVAARLTLGQMWTAAWGMPVLCLAIAFFCSTVLDKTIVALGASIVVSLLVLPLVGHLSYVGNGCFSWGRALISSWVLAAGFVTASFVAFCRHELWPGGSATLKAVFTGLGCVLLSGAITPISWVWGRLPAADEIREIRALAGMHWGPIVFEAVDKSGRSRLWSLTTGAFDPRPLTERSDSPILIHDASGLWSWDRMCGQSSVLCSWRGRLAAVECRTRMVFELQYSARDHARWIVGRHADTPARRVEVIAYSNPADLWGSPFLAGVRGPSGAVKQFFWAHPVTGSVQPVEVGTNALPFLLPQGQREPSAVFPDPDGARLVAQTTGSPEIWLIDLHADEKARAPIGGTVESVQWTDPLPTRRQARVVVRDHDTDRAVLWLEGATAADSSSTPAAKSIRPNPGAYVVRLAGQDECGLWIVRDGRARCLVADGLRDAPLQCAHHWYSQDLWVFIRNGRELWRMDEKRKGPFKIWPRVVSTPSRDSVDGRRDG